MKKQTILITGASRGIGREIAKLFAKNNYNVIINYLNSYLQAQKLQKELQAVGCNVMLHKADITKNQQVKEMVQNTFEWFGDIDVLVNNAGIAQQKLFIDISEIEWDNMINVHIKGMFNCCKLILPKMISHKKGKIINISSMWGLTGASCEVHYSTAKAAVIGFTKALAKEVGLFNIQVNCIAPGIIDTDMNKYIDNKNKQRLINDTPLSRYGTAEEVAQSVFYFASKEADFITGHVLNINGGFFI